MEALLEVRNLTVVFNSHEGPATAVDRVSFTVGRRESLALVGESGCGKSVTSLAVMGLVPDPPGVVRGDGIFLEERNLLSLSEPQMRKVRGNEISMIFQEPMTSLNPVVTIGKQLCESFTTHSSMRRGEAMERSRELLEMVRIPDAARCLAEYPHRLSGGMRQRIMIAMAMACRPRLLIADEPTTALDVTIQAQVLKLLTELRRELGMSLLLITHDLGVVAENAERVAVMYAGRIVEEAPVGELFARPLHPYTRGLMAARPRVDGSDTFRTTRLKEIPGNVPSLRNLPAGCAFAPRCPERVPVCAERRPALVEIESGRRVSCFVATGVEGAA